MKRAVKCRKCGIIINPDEVRHKVPGGYRCDPCNIFAEKEKKEWSELFEYLKEKYFIATLPTTIIKELKEKRKTFEYNIILGCFKSIENNLIKNYNEKDFKSDYNRSRYLMASIEGNIDNYYRQQLKKNKEKQEIKIMDDFIIYENKGVIEKSPNYDFLD